MNDFAFKPEVEVTMYFAAFVIFDLNIFFCPHPFSVAFSFQRAKKINFMCLKTAFLTVIYLWPKSVWFMAPKICVSFCCLHCTILTLRKISYFICTNLSVESNLVFCDRSLSKNSISEYYFALPIFEIESCISYRTNKTLHLYLSFR